MVKEKANPSEALKTLEVLDKTISPLLEPILTEYEDDLSDKITANYFALKQSLLKAQEQDFNYKNIIIPFFDELVELLGLTDIDEILDRIKEQGKVLEIIKEKNVDTYTLETSINLEHYNSEIKLKNHNNTYSYEIWYELTEEEFEILKRWTSVWKWNH